ncbi:putative aldouronate transport system substrate-binding protein [Oribacterium sp. KHPX15]|uniref:extracellular solute-binding protein n=1 Tax=Oribacterium sp. KHPX15 TaxID=1855342 RepID=UPI00089547DA|nr:extracellular solute-binding protein [Oribacterium sp. KHPX15]SEA00713.1 putative aldouronate transport system substrate-binding protein [Oribacterium sp. KHPX15]
MKKKLSIAIGGFLTASMMLTACGGTTSSTEPTSGSAEDDYKVATVRWADWGEDYHKGFPDQAAAEAGINITWNTILNSDWGDKKAVLLAGGNLPDAFVGSICFTETDILTNAGTFIALDDYIDEYMPNLKKIMEEDETMRALATSADGHIYGLPSKKPCRPTVANQMFINKVWLDNLGLSVPTTYDEYVEVLRAFRDEDANGNGDPTDEIPFGQGYADSVMFFCLPFGTTIGADSTYMMAVQDGKPVYLPITDNYKDGIKAMHECFEEGLIDPEIFTEDTSMRDAKLMSETPIVGSAPGWTADATFGANADQYAALPALVGPDGNQYISSDPEHWNYSRYEFVVTSDCKDPGPLLAWADKFYSEDASIQNFYGAFGVGVEKDESAGTYKVLEPNDGNSADTFAWIKSLRDFGPKYVADGFNDKVSYAGENGDAAKLLLDKDVKQYACEAYPNVSYTPDQLNTLATLYADLEAYVSSNQATWVADGGLDEQWDKYISQLEMMGINDFLQIQQDAYDCYNANK